MWFVVYLLAILAHVSYQEDTMANTERIKQLKRIENSTQLKQSRQVSTIRDDWPTHRIEQNSVETTKSVDIADVIDKGNLSINQSGTKNEHDSSEGWLSYFIQWIVGKKDREPEDTNDDAYLSKTNGALNATLDLSSSDPQQLSLLIKDKVHVEELEDSEMDELLLSDGPAVINENSERNDPGGASLAFIFDSTGSMEDELNQVKVGAAQILAALLANQEILIHNFILVPFKDPGIGPVLVTTNPKEFQTQIEDIAVNGGGDCPEMSIGAIKKALELSRPNSYFYVFTDASAKDRHLQDNVLALIQQLQAQVVFILTGTCDDLGKGNDGVYESIADASSGQVYHLSKSEVKEVLRYVKVSLRSNKVNLLSLNRPAPIHRPDNHTVLIDETLEEFTVSVSGKNAGISIRDPHNTSTSQPSNVESLLTLDNVKIVNIREPNPGQWQLSVDSDSDYSLRATGRSVVHFRHGFSTVPTADMAHTNLRPLQGALCYLVIQTSDAVTVHNLTSVDIVGLTGSVLQTLPLTPVTDSPGTYIAANFTSPAEFFHLGISGYGKDGFPIKRVTSTAISASLPEKPRISMRARTVAQINSSITVSCHVTSLVPFSVIWFRNNHPVTFSVTHPQTGLVGFTIDKVTETSEGNYTCQAKNLAGIEWKTTYLSVTGPLPSIAVPSRVMATVGNVAELSCGVNSDFYATVRWSQLSTKNKYSGILHPVLNGLVHKNHSLIIANVSERDEGWYVCSAESRVGVGEARTFLEVRDPLKVTVVPSQVSFTKGDSVKLRCLASGRSIPILQWRRDLITITNREPHSYLEQINGELHLLLDFLDESRAGVYSCVATNSEESVTANAELFYMEKPTVSAVANSVMVRLGAEAVLPCIASGVPVPTITWRRHGQLMNSDSHYQMVNGTLHIINVVPEDAGEYSCVAANSAGEGMDHIGLFVGSPPVFLQKPRDKSIQLHHNGTVFCTATGSPSPDTSWSRHESGTELNSRRMITLPGGALRITSAKVSDSGRYRCTAQNIFGNVSADVTVTITGTVKPSIDKSLELTQVQIVAGGLVTVPCGITLGNPPGHVTWVLNGIPFDSTMVTTDGNLELAEVSAASTGNYTCNVASALGNVSRTYQLDVLEEPHVEPQEIDFKSPVILREGGRVVLSCPVKGNPRPRIAWYKAGHPVIISAQMYQDVNGSLVIVGVQGENAGMYTCTATNNLGSTSHEIVLQVYVSPKPAAGSPEADVVQAIVEGHNVAFNCEMHAVPAPEVSWFKNSLPLTMEGIEPNSQILRFVATVEDSGTYKCVVTNEAGTASKEFQLNILVPPRIIDPGEEPVIARSGSSVTLQCAVTGIPTPDVLWRRQGLYLTQNTTEMTLVGVSLIISNVTEEAAGAYVCDAENSAGIAQQTFYLQVTFPPRIVEEDGESNVVSVTVREGNEFSLPCLAEGSPKPEITWNKDGEPIHPYTLGVRVQEDNTLLFVQVRAEHAGVYQCRATNKEGFSVREFQLDVASPPTLLADLPTHVEVNEGASLALTCPISPSAASGIRWIKDGKPLVALLLERGDEAPIRLSGDRRQLLLAEAHPGDSGNYSCVAVNAAGRTDALFLVSVLMTPHFEEFNHVARRSLLVGGTVNLNCSVSGHPLPQVSWRKDHVPVTPGRPPGVLLSRDKQHLTIPSARTQHSGTYTCTAANKITSKEREFYITVLEPPRISGSGQEDVELLLGQRMVLACPAGGEPKPQISWYSEDCDGDRRALNVTTAELVLDRVTANDSTMYFCEAVSTAGTAMKLFNVTVLAAPIIEGENLEDVRVVKGQNISLRCMVRGVPRPEVSWLHNGVEVETITRRRRDLDQEVSQDKGIVTSQTFRDTELVASLTLNAVNQQAEGLYTAIASNRAGFSEKKFRVVVAVAPRAVGILPREVTVLTNHRAELQCPVEATPPPLVAWHHFSNPVTAADRYTIDNGRKLIINSASRNDSGNYTCFASNYAGNITLPVLLHVLEPPWFLESSTERVEAVLSENVVMNCTAQGTPPPTISWLKEQSLLSRSGDTFIKISDVSFEAAGQYVCVATNVAGAAEKTFILDVLEPPALQDSPNDSRNVSLHRRLQLDCPMSGYPQPNITWIKDGVGVVKEGLLPDVHLMSAGSQLVVLHAGPEHVGEYKCVAQNSAGAQENSIHVAVFVTASWTGWSPWSPCSASCGPGLETRYRTCNFGPGPIDPRLVVDKTQCVGNDREQRLCLATCSIDGGWSEWSPWSECSATCGNATRQRKRMCSSPPPSNHGKPCDGSAEEVEPCLLDACHPVWSSWSMWSDCSRSCGGGEKHKSRSCLSGACQGPNSITEVCNEQPCLGGGRWFPWGKWSPCSATCGRGIKRRIRHCRSAYARDKPCKDKVQMEVCIAQPCSAKLRLIGKLNGESIDSEIDANLTGSKVAARSAAEAAKWFPYAPLLLAPVAWNTAVENDNAANGFSLTKGRFLSQSEISFVNGDGLKIKTEGQGVNSEGLLTVVIEVAGEAPVFEPSASVRIKTLEQDFVQVSNHELISVAEDTIAIGSDEIPFQVNSSIKYDGHQGMPYLVENLRLTDMQSDMAAREFTASAAVSKKFSENVCPPGFSHDLQYLHCSDLDECLEQPCGSRQECTNTWGSFTCGCLAGYSLQKPGGCQDINECELKPARCHHSCTNTEGSYNCFCSMGYTLAADGSTCIGDEDEVYDELDKDEHEEDVSMSWIARRAVEPQEHFGLVTSDSCPPGYTSRYTPTTGSSVCQDIDECLDTGICGDDGLCLNTLGSYQCLDGSCPAGFSRETPTTCTTSCEEANCRRGSLVAETIVFALLQLHTTKFHTFEDLLQLSVREHTAVARQRTRLLEGQAVRLRTVGNHTSLYAPAPLKVNTLYRVVAEVSSLGFHDELLYSTDFVVFIILCD